MTVATDFVHDIVGNLVFDGAYWYQYDAWNRLLQVNHAGTLSATDFLTNGQLDPEPGHEPGELVARFAYDGLGRLIHKQGTLDSGQLLKEDYYYDGVRRIQAAIQRPPAAPPPPPPPESMFEMMGFFGGVWGRTEREYVYGPEYVDEFAFVLDEAGDAFYVLQDANYNVMALVDAAAEVVEQYVYGPYGDLVPVHADNPADPLARMGHQGLFFARLDGWADDPPMVPGAVGLYYNRNRWYSPHLGRFIERDVNETALPIISALAF
ncbi:MAG: hypothetical protein ACE5I3_15105, partial [Phycisphaerae bacterium]